MTNQENTEEINDAEPTEINTTETTVKEKQKRKIRAPHRYLPDGTYDNKPLSKTYFRDYWQKTKAPIECEHCGVVFAHKNNLYKHGYRSKRCMKIREAYPALAALALVAVQADMERLIEELQAESNA